MMTRAGFPRDLKVTGKGTQGESEWMQCANTGILARWWCDKKPMFTVKTDPTNHMTAVTNYLISSVVTDLETDCEILWVQINLIGTKSLHIGSFYRPPNSDMTALDNLNLSLERLTHRTNGNIWLGGDFNAPHIDWSSMEVSPMAGGKRQEQQRLIDI